MTIYRADVQQKVSTPLVATGVYYWTNVWYFSARNPTEFGDARDLINRIQSRAFCSDVTSDRILITVAATGAVVQHGTFHWTPVGVLPVSDTPITNCVLVWLYSGGKRVGYKRFRVPVPASGMAGGLLSAAFVSSYYSSGPVNEIFTGRLCSKAGQLIDNAIIDSRVSMWQIRHGTKRAERRAV